MPGQPAGLAGWRGARIRLLTLACSVAWRHASADPVHALVLGWRVLPARCRPALRLAGRYGRAVAAWGSGDREAALRVLASSPRQQAAFALAVGWPEAAAAVLPAVPPSRRPLLAARLAWQQGRLSDAVRELDGARGCQVRRARALREALRAELRVRDPAWPGLPPLPPGHTSRPVPGRVLHIVTDALPAANAGYTVRTQQVAVSQRAAGLDPHVVTRCGFPVAQGRLDARPQLDLAGITYHRLLPFLLPARADTAFRRGLELAAGLTERLRPAVLHPASNYVNGQLALALRERYRLPVVYEVRGFLEDSWQSRSSGDVTGSELYRLSRELETHCMREADLVVTLGEAMRAEIVSRGISPEKVIVVPNAVPAEFLQPLPDAGPLRAALGIGPAEPVAGLVSSLYAHEGIPVFLESAALLRQRGVPVRPLIVGDGPDRAALEHLAGELGLAGTAVFTGRVPAADVRRYHAVLDLFVIPRTNDRVCQLVTPLKPVEAMASGLCVIASEVGALREIVKHGSTGTLIVPQDAAALADQMESLIYSPDVRRELGASAREWVSRYRTWARNAERYREAYRFLGVSGL